MPIRSISLDAFLKKFPKSKSDFSLVPLPSKLKWGELSLKYEYKVLAKLCHMQSPEKVFEFGTFEGLTTLLFAQNTDPDSMIYTLDLPRKEKLETKNLDIFQAVKLAKEKSGIK